MAFASLYVPDFLVQALVRGEPAIRGRAIALVDGTPPLCNVVAASEAALRAGITLGMAKPQAEQFGNVAIRQRSRGQEAATHTALLDLGWSISPRIEDTAPDTITLDLAGLHSLFGSEEEIARQLTEGASRFGLTAQVALAPNPDAAIHAARGFPGITVIPAGEESQRLGCLPVSVLAPSSEILETLERWGVRTCKALAALPIPQLSERLGQEGVRLHELARAMRVRSLVLAEPVLDFVEEMELEHGVAELEPLAFLLGRLLDQLCARLIARSLAASAIRLRFRLETSPHSTFEKVLSLPVPMRDSKMLLKLLRLLLQAEPPPAPILKLVLTAEPSRPRVTPGGLFLPRGPDPEKLELTIARLANLVGDGNIGSPELADTHRPGEFRISRFLPPHDGANRQKNEGAPGSGFRVFRPAPRASVALRDGRPVRVSFRGLQGEVASASGPWRTSGDWWRTDPWQHDEWDLEIQFDASSRTASRRKEQISETPLPLYERGNRVPAGPRQGLQHGPRHGLYRFYYDERLQGWFVRGAYD